MPIGVVSDEELEVERSSLEVRDMTRGRGSQRQVPSSMRALVASEALTNGNAEAAKLGVSPSSVSAYKAGARSTASIDTKDTELESKNAAVKSKAAKKAHKTLLSAIGAITKDKLSEAKARDLSGIAKDMAAVVRTLEPEKQEDEAVKFVVFAPPMKKEEDFKVIEVKD